ncbi:MAG: transposon-encoded TnpW family protein [Firmicutes bacterium]|nr:transposon-encoded TnpW family protein [Bacillota bacterium]
MNNENKNEIVTVQETNSSQENVVFEKKIGRTRYHVHLFFDPNSKETMQQKIMRMMKNELEAELDKPA